MTDITTEELEAIKDRAARLVNAPNDNQNHDMTWTWLDITTLAGTDVPALVANIEFLRSEYDIEHKQHQALRVLWDEEHAKRLELEAELADWRDTQRSVMAERCGDDREHCTCVPVLRREIERLRDLLQASLDLQAAEQATSDELRRQMDVLALNYTADENRLRAALEDVIESWSVHNAAVVAARALGRENVLELAEGKARSADEIVRLRAQNDKLRRDWASAEAEIIELRTQLKIAQDRYNNYVGLVNDYHDDSFA